MPHAAPGQRFLRRDKRARRQTRDSGDFLQSQQCAQRPLRPGPRFRFVSDRVAVRLSAEVNRRPKPVVVVRDLFVGGQVAGHAEMRTGHQPVPHVTLLDTLVEILRFILQRHRPPFDERDSPLSANPNLASLAAFLHPDVAGMVIEQPASAVKILPAVPTKCGVRIKARRALVAAEPDRAGLLEREGFQAIDRSAFCVLPGCPARFSADFGGHFRSLDRKVTGKFLRLSDPGAGRQHQTDCPKQQAHGAHHQGRG